MTIDSIIPGFWRKRQSKPYSVNQILQAVEVAVNSSIHILGIMQVVF